MGLCVCGYVGMWVGGYVCVSMEVWVGGYVGGVVGGCWGCLALETYIIDVGRQA